MCTNQCDLISQFSQAFFGGVCVCMLARSHACKCVFACLHMCRHACKARYWRWLLDLLYCFSPPYPLRGRLSLNPELISRLDWLASELQGCSLTFPLPALGLQIHVTMSGVHMGARVLSSRHHVCAAVSYPRHHACTAVFYPRQLRGLRPVPLPGRYPTALWPLCRPSTSVPQTVSTRSWQLLLSSYWRSSSSTTATASSHCP